MQSVTAQCHDVSCLHGLSEVHEHVGKVGVGHFIFAVAYHLVDAVCRIIANARYRSACQGRQQIVICLKVQSVMEEHSSCYRMLLFAIAKCQFHILASLLKGHAKAAF